MTDEKAGEPKHDGSGHGTRDNMGRGGCDKTQDKGRGYGGNRLDDDDDDDDED